MHKSNPASQELSALIGQAQAEVSQREGVHTPRARPRPFLSGSKLLVLPGAAIALCGYWAWSTLGPPPQSQIARDLEVTLYQARTMVEQFKAAQGALPETLPHAAMASVVRYERDESNYKLVASMMGVHVTLGPDGRNVTETRGR